MCLDIHFELKYSDLLTLPIEGNRFLRLQIVFALSAVCRAPQGSRGVQEVEGCVE